MSSKLPSPRCFGHLCIMNDRLFLVGGAGKLSRREKTTSSLSSIHVLDLNSLVWRHEAELAIPRHGHAVTNLGTQIMAIGGVTTVYVRGLSNTECYCTERGKTSLGWVPLGTDIL